MLLLVNLLENWEGKWCLDKETNPIGKTGLNLISEGKISDYALGAML